jgi:hypothetical protein
MSTRASIIYNETNDYYLHLYHEMLDDKYYLEIDGKDIIIKKSTVKKLLRDIANNKIKFNL